MFYSNNNMRILTYIIFILLIGSCNISNPIHQSKHYQSYLFTQQEMVGNIPVDENDNPLQKGYWLKHTLIVEVADTSFIQWKSFMLNQHEVMITQQSLRDSVINVGTDKFNQKVQQILPEKGKKFWIINAEDFNNELSSEKANINIEGLRKEKLIKISFSKAPIMLKSEIKP